MAPLLSLLAAPLALIVLLALAFRFLGFFLRAAVLALVAGAALAACSGGRNPLGGLLPHLGPQPAPVVLLRPGVARGSGAHLRVLGIRPAAHYADQYVLLGNLGTLAVNLGGDVLALPGGARFALEGELAPGQECRVYQEAEGELPCAGRWQGLGAARLFPKSGLVTLSQGSTIQDQWSYHEQGGAGCGKERWPVKTMDDPQAALVDPQPLAMSVAALRQLTAPTSLPADGRAAPWELRRVTVTARLVAARREQDHDFHLVIADPQDPRLTMIAELPDPACAAVANGTAAPSILQARKEFIDHFGTPPSDQFVPLHGLVTITGVVFFDFPHGQYGLAPNAVELHPVLDLSFSATP